MPLPESVPRKHLHSRRVDCRGYAREDGLWEVEAHMVDTKSYDFPHAQCGQTRAGESVHDMWLRIVFDDGMKIRQICALTETGPFHICPEINAQFKKLEGLTIGAGWKRQVKERVGGVKGCTHLFELLDSLATTAFQLYYGAKSQAVREGQLSLVEHGYRSFLVNSCHAYAEDGDLVKEWFPRFYRKPADT